MKIIVIDKNCNFKQAIANDDSIQTLCKKAGFKSESDFSLRTTWNGALKDGKTYCIELYAKNKGRAGYENKYDFPPPVDNDLFFGSCVLINKKGDLTTEIWKEVYNHLFGGFEDLDDESDTVSLYENVTCRTKQGYDKDGFVVDDDELTEEDYI